MRPKPLILIVKSAYLDYEVTYSGILPRKMFMFSKSMMALAVAGAMFTGSAFSTTVSMTANPGDPTTYSGSFNATLATNTYQITFPTGAFSLFAVVSASHYNTSGYNVNSVTFDGHSFHPDTNTSNANGSRTNDSWSYESETITPGVHTVIVKGIPYATNGIARGSFVVSTQPLGVLAPVPEPAAIAMMLAGLALLGGLQLRSKNKASQLAG